MYRVRKSKIETEIDKKNLARHGETQIMTQRDRETERNTNRDTEKERKTKIDRETEKTEGGKERY